MLLPLPLLPLVLFVLVLLLVVVVVLLLRLMLFLPAPWPVEQRRFQHRLHFLVEEAHPPSYSAHVLRAGDDGLGRVVLLVMVLLLSGRRTGLASVVLLRCHPLCLRRKQCKQRSAAIGLTCLVLRVASWVSREGWGRGLRACSVPPPFPQHALAVPASVVFFCFFPTGIGNCFAAGRRMEMALSMGGINRCSDRPLLSFTPPLCFLYNVICCLIAVGDADGEHSAALTVQTVQ